ncbi:hypothetical protein HHK36_001665 [Tetracentron sinense]|uniref:SHSP domain-containing protein n=1 Tax=Tetracentron sinense TaxID=13715 RepID=A0A835DS84_TETSI|nr:hypothetical protein HHK36_001665 [Tetracentron sinense]
MENQVVSRRITMLMGHFAGNEDLSANHVSPMNCSSSMNSVIRRCDNRMFFSRQGSSSQACFMRQGNSVQPGVPLKCSGSVKEDLTDASREPLFSRSTKPQPNLPNIVSHQPVRQECMLSLAEPTAFARLSKGLSGQKQFCSKKIRPTSRSNGIEWLPRMDVAVSGCNYVVTIELTGVRIDDIRVEVDDRNLTVTGKRLTQWWRVASGSKDSAYHKREILQGPCKVVWPLPIDVNKDRVSAEFV